MTSHYPQRGGLTSKTPSWLRRCGVLCTDTNLYSVERKNSAKSVMFKGELGELELV